MALTLRKPHKPLPAPAPQILSPEAPLPDAAEVPSPAPTASAQPVPLYSDRIALFVWLAGAGIMAVLMLKDLVTAMLPW
jgi:hypothetical protein